MSASYQRMPSATHGRWYTRDVEDTISGVADSSPAVWGAIDGAAIALTTWSDALPDTVIDGGFPNSVYEETPLVGGEPDDTHERFVTGGGAFE